MRSAIRTAGLTVAASLGLHGGLALLAATAMTVLPEWQGGASRTTGRKLRVARAYHAGDQYILNCRVQQDLSAPVEQGGGKLLVALEGLWEIKEVTPKAGQPVKYTFTVHASQVISGDQAGPMFREGAVIAGLVDGAGVPAWTVDGAPAGKAMTHLFRQVLPLPAVRDADDNAACFDPGEPVEAEAVWPVNEPAMATRLTADGSHLSGPAAGTVKLSPSVEWNDEIPGHHLLIEVSTRADALPGLPEGTELKSAAVRMEGEVLLPDDSTIPVFHEKWITTGMLDVRLPGMASPAQIQAVTTVVRDLSFYFPPESEPQEVAVVFVQDAKPPPADRLPQVPRVVPEEEEEQPAEPAAAQPKGPIHVVAPDVPSIVPLDTNTPFISDRNMRAAATAAPVAGADPRIGSQAGMELPGLSLFNARANPEGSSSPPPTPAEPVTTPEPEVAQQPPPPAPEPEPQDRPPDKPAMTKTEDPNAPAAPPEKPKAPDFRDRPPDPLAMTEPPKPRPKPRPATKPVDPVQATPAPNGGKPVVSSVKTKKEGSLAIRGSESMVDAKDTPEGRFYSALHESIGRIWNTRLATVHGLSGTGVVEVEFDIDPNGRVSNVKLVDPGKANPVLEDVCLTSVIKAKVPPIPASLKREMQDPLSGGKLHQKINFYKIPSP